MVYGDIRDLDQAVSFPWSDVDSGTSGTDPRYDQQSKGVREHVVNEVDGEASKTLAIVMSRRGDELGCAKTAPANYLSGAVEREGYRRMVLDRIEHQFDLESVQLVEEPALIAARHLAGESRS